LLGVKRALGWQERERVMPLLGRVMQGPERVTVKGLREISDDCTVRAGHTPHCS
jgi:hypothetical protein